MSWTPTTLEDRLLGRHREEHPGELFLDVPIGGGNGSHGPRRINSEPYEV